MPRGVTNDQPATMAETSIHWSFSQSPLANAAPVHCSQVSADLLARFFLRFFFLAGFLTGSRLVSVSATSTLATASSSETVPIAPSGSGSGLRLEPLRAFGFSV